MGTERETKDYTLRRSISEETDELSADGRERGLNHNLEIGLLESYRKYCLSRELFQEDSRISSICFVM